MIAYDCIWLRYWKCESDLLLFWSFILSNTGDECFLVCCIILDAAFQLLSQYSILHTLNSQAIEEQSASFTISSIHVTHDLWGPRKCVISSVIKMSSALGRYFLYLSWKPTARRCHGVAYECKCLCCSETRWLHLDLGKSEASWDSKLFFFYKKSNPKPGNQSKYNWYTVYIYIHIIHCILYMMPLLSHCWSWCNKPPPKKADFYSVWCKRWNSHNFGLVLHQHHHPKAFGQRKNEIFGAPLFVCLTLGVQQTSLFFF